MSCISATHGSSHYLHQILPRFEKLRAADGYIMVFIMEHLSSGVAMPDIVDKGCKSWLTIVDYDC
jgi:hypothetical protein